MSPQEEVSRSSPGPNEVVPATPANLFLALPSRAQLFGALLGVTFVTLGRIGYHSELSTNVEGISFRIEALAAAVFSLGSFLWILPTLFEWRKVQKRTKRLSDSWVIAAGITGFVAAILLDRFTDQAVLLDDVLIVGCGILMLGLYATSAKWRPLLSVDSTGITLPQKMHLKPQDISSWYWDKDDSSLRFDLGPQGLVSQSLSFCNTEDVSAFVESLQRYCPSPKGAYVFHQDRSIDGLDGCVLVFFGVLGLAMILALTAALSDYEPLLRAADWIRQPILSW